MHRLQSLEKFKTILTITQSRFFHNNIMKRFVGKINSSFALYNLFIISLLFSFVSIFDMMEQRA